MAQGKSYSVIVQCVRDVQTDTMQLHVTSADTGKPVPLDNAAFLVRISIDDDAQLVRCLIRHLTSGREAHIQSTTQLQAFITSCLLAKNGPGTDLADTSETVLSETTSSGSELASEAAIPEQSQEGNDHNSDDTPV